jgi:microcystin-dependent protein
MPSNTTNFNWIKPTVGSDDDVWGDYLDTNLDSQDSLIRRFMNNFINTSAPAEAQAGTTWLDNTSNPYVLKIYDGADWITIGTMNTTTNSFTTTSAAYIGDYKFSGQSANHGGWLLCNGQSLSTSTYSGLFAQIGYAFGGSGASFSAPDLRGRVPGAIGTGSGLSTRTLGQSVGEENHVLTIPEIPSHTHTVPSFSNGGWNNFGWNTATSLNPDTTITSNATGGGGGHNTMQPTLFVGNFFIYSGV